MNLILTRDRLAICQLPHDAAHPVWATSAGAFFSITRTNEELSIVCREGLAPPDIKQESGWRAFKVEGPLDFALTGILAALLDPLAQAGISVFCVATFNTDYVLVRDASVDAAINAFREDGHTVIVA
ncbi:MAG TPA: ACT domain-containing protein [Lacunisphaera sp.]|nr:ACT domain-containing protein [Lacunisphaera sp.]